jgi:hypothetical protein
MTVRGIAAAFEATVGALKGSQPAVIGLEILRAPRTASSACSSMAMLAACQPLTAL